MLRKILLSTILISLFIPVMAKAQDENPLTSIVDNKVEKMKRELKLSDSQAQAIWPIVKDYVSKRQELVQEAAGNGIVDHIALKATLSSLQDQENQLLSKVLTPDQMKEWIDREHMMAALNPDGAETAVDDDGTTLSPEGASFKF